MVVSDFTPLLYIPDLTQGWTWLPELHMAGTNGSNSNPNSIRKSSLLQRTDYPCKQGGYGGNQCTLSYPETSCSPSHAVLPRLQLSIKIWENPSLDSKGTEQMNQWSEECVVSAFLSHLSLPPDLPLHSTPTALFPRVAPNGQNYATARKQTETLAFSFPNRYRKTEPCESESPGETQWERSGEGSSHAVSKPTQAPVPSNCALCDTDMKKLNRSVEN